MSAWRAVQGRPAALSDRPASQPDRVTSLRGRAPALPARTTFLKPDRAAFLTRTVRDRLPRETVVRMARCMSVSIFTTLVSLVTLAVLAGGLGTQAWLANVIATAVGTVPSYLLNRRWVWRRTGPGDAWREVMPFWALSFTGLVLSTVAVDRADHLAAALGLGGANRTGTLLAANVGAFGLLWIGQFLLLDRVLFRDRRQPAPQR